MSDELVKRLRDVSENRFMPNGIAKDCGQAADRIEALEAAIKRQSGAAATLRAITLAEVQDLKDMDRSEYNAAKTLDSERDANAILTAQVEALEAALVRADFLIDRINDWTPDNLTDESCTDWLGHVEPALTAYRQARDATR